MTAQGLDAPALLWRLSQSVRKGSRCGIGLERGTIDLVVVVGTRLMLPVKDAPRDMRNFLFIRDKICARLCSLGHQRPSLGYSYIPEVVRL